MSNSVTPGVDLGKLFNHGMDEIASKGKELQTEMETIMAQEEVSPEDMLAIQFKMGQYNAMLESLSTITKSLSDSLKSIAQRAG